jgi:hypothetical protein
MAEPFQIVDAYGRKLYPAPAHRPNESRPQPQLKPHTHQNVTSRDRWELTNQSRALYGSNNLIAAAIDERAKFAFANGCFIRSQSKDSNFAQALESEINEVFYRDPNVLGDAHDMHSTLQNFSINLERDGGQAAVFDDATGKVMVIPTTLIGSGFGLKGAGNGMLSPLSKTGDEMSYWRLSSGGFSNYGGINYGYEIIKDPASPYNGSRIIDGFIVDRNRARLAVRVLGFDEQGNPSFKDIPSEQIRVDYKTRWSDQIGFIPILATSIMALVDVQDFDYYIKQAMKLSAQKAVTRKSKDGTTPKTSGVGYTYVDETGSIQTTNPGENPPANATRIQAYEMNVAGMVELSTDNNEEIGFVDFQRPSMNEEQFVERIQRGYLHKIWPYDLIFGKNVNAAYSRTLVKQVCMTIWEEQRLGEKFLRWSVNNRIAWAMRRGHIPKNDNLLDPYSFEVIWPAEFTGDDGYDNDIKLKKLGRNLLTHDEITSSDGRTHAQIQRKNLDYVDRLIADAEGIAKKHPDAGMTAKDVLLMVDNLGSPNPTMNQQAKPQDTTPEPSSHEAPKQKTVKINRDAAGKATHYDIIEE